MHAVIYLVIGIVAIFGQVITTIVGVYRPEVIKDCVAWHVGLGIVPLVIGFFILVDAMENKWTAERDTKIWSDRCTIAHKQLDAARKLLNEEDE